MSKSEVSWLIRSLGISLENLQSKESGFDDRLRVQKAAFLLKYLAVSAFDQFSFDMYLKGPYSASLAQDYYSITEQDEPKKPIELSEGSTEDKLFWFTSHDNRWLEVASSILLIKYQDKGINEELVYPILRISKPWVTEEYFSEIRRELESKHL